MTFLRRATIALALPLLAGSAVTLHVSPARADDDAVVDMARQRFAEGVKYYDAGDYERARAAFLQAYALKKHPAVLLNLAQCELRSNRPADAANHFAEYLQTNPDAGPEERQSAIEGLEEAKASVGEVMIDVDVEGADVYLDGNEVGRTPLGRSVFVMPGQHEVTARRGNQEASTTVVADAGAAITADVRLMAPPPAAASEESPLEIPGEPMSFGEYLGGHPVAWVGMGLTGIGVGLGIGGAIVAKDRYDTADDISNAIIERAVTEAGTVDPNTPLCRGARSEFPDDNIRNILDPACARRQETIDEGDTWKTVAITSFVVAGASAVGTVAYYFIAQPTKSEPESAGADDDLSVALSPVFTPEHRGLFVQGTF